MSHTDLFGVVVVRRQTLRDEVVLVEADMSGARVEQQKPVAARQPLQLGRHDLDDELPARLEVRGGILEARDLSRLRAEIEDRVVDDVGERERALDPSRCHVADLHRDRIGLPAQHGDHVRREVDARDPNAASGERHRDPAGADRQLEGAAARERDEEVDDGLDGHPRRARVIPLGDLSCEVVRRHQPALFSFPCFFA